jgi:hypothetical protein
MTPALLADARRVADMTGHRMHLVIPSILARGERFTLRVSVVGADALPPERFDHMLRFEGSVGVEGLPASIRLAAPETGVSLDGLTATGPDTVLIRARVEGTGMASGDPLVRSNPAWVFERPGQRLFWGDLHVHTRFSNCSGWRCLDPEWCYAYARDVSFLDFTAAADHLRGIAAEADRWPRLQAAVRTWNRDGRFVAFLGFESSHAQGFGGDNNAYYADDDAPYFWLDREDMRGIAPKVHLRDLWAFLDRTGRRYLTIPHHTGRAAKYRTWEEDYHDPRREPLFEIYSSWGSSETRHTRLPISNGNNDAPSYFTDALKAGARFGVIASSDDHATLPGGIHHFRVDPFAPTTLNGHAHKGLAAIWASDLSRNALFEAMTRRATYATTDSRTLLEVRLGDARMGQAIPADATLRRAREIRVRLTLDHARVARVHLMRNGAPWQSKPVTGEDLDAKVSELVFEDAEPLDSVLVRGARYRPEPFAVYYARVEDNEGYHAWSSPLWVDAG